MSSTRISAPILAKNEANNLPGCIASVHWANEVIVVVDRASRDETLAIAERLADLVAIRTFDDFASQRNAALDLASGDWIFAIDADERATPELAAEIRRATSEANVSHAGYHVPIRSVILGRSFSYSGTQHDLPLRLFRRGAGRWVGAVHETVAIEGSVGRLRNALQHRTIPDMVTFLRKINEYTTLEAIKFEREGRVFRAIDLTIRPAWTFAKLYLGKQGFRDGLEGFVFWRALGSVGGDPALETPRAAPGPEGIVTRFHEVEVASRFDESRDRFRREVETDDFRLSAIRPVVEPWRGPRVLDLGCGKGRFARRLADEGADVVGIDLSAGMLAEASGLDRVRCSARRLPFADGTFDVVLAVEVLEHVASIEDVLNEARARPPAGGGVGHRGQERGIRRRQPSVASESGRKMDRRAQRAMDVPFSGAGPRILVLARAIPPAITALFDVVRRHVPAPST